MKDMQAHVRKIRSDAAECLVLSNLVTEERRHLFGRIAEHLNSLALEIETEAVTNVPDEPSAMPYQQVNFAAQPNAPAEATAPADPQQAARSRRQLPWSLLVVLIVIAGAVLWAVNRTESTLSNLLPKTGAEFRASAHELATLLSEERGERKALSDRLSALIARLDSLAKELDDLKSLRAGTTAPSTRGSVAQEDQSSGTEAKPQPAEEMGTRCRNHQQHFIGEPRRGGSKRQAPLQRLTTPVSESTDQVGTISSIRAEI